jgi:hypothetical protein
MVNPDVIRVLSEKLIRENRIVEAAWVGFRLHSIPPGLPEDEVELLKLAFFAGAAFLFGGFTQKFHNVGYRPHPIVLGFCERIHRELQTYLDHESCSDDLGPS